MYTFNECVNLKEEEYYGSKLHQGLNSIHEMMKNRIGDAHNRPQDWSGPMKVCQDLMGTYPEYISFF